MLSKYKKVFAEALEIQEENAETSTNKTVANWDSLRHMNLISAIEDEFDIEIEPDDVIEFISFDAGIDILKRYGVEF